MSTVQVNNLPESIQGLSFLWLEITSKCNLECVHCYADSGPHSPLLGQMSTDAWIGVLAEAAALGCREVQFIGGEPTLHPDLDRMISFAAANGYTLIEVFTNATRLDAHLLSTLLEHRVHVAVSFYSDNPDIHDSITKSPGSFRHTVANLRRMISAGVPIRAGIIQMSENTDHISGARMLLESLGLRDIKVDRRRDVGRGMTKLVGDPMATLCGECWKGKLCVTSSGRMFPCVFSRFTNVGCATDGVRNTLSGASLLAFRASFRQYCEQRRVNDLRRSQVLSAEVTSVLNSGQIKNITGEFHADSCNPTCAPCGPQDFIECGPGGSQCNPEFRACHPASSCAPSAGPCGPDSKCNPSYEPSRDCGPTD